MGKKIKYNVFDTETNQQIGTNLTSGEVKKLTGAGNIRIYNYMEYGNKINGRYSVTIGTQLIREERKMRNGFWKEWDAECERIKELPKSILQMRIVSV